MHCFSLFTIEYYLDYKLVVGSCAASAAAAIAIVRASEGQVMMPRHHCLPCCCRQRARVHRCRCHRHRAGERGTGDDAEASLSALSPSSLCYVVCSAAVVAMGRANEGQVMMLRHHHPPCHRCQGARASTPPLPPPSPLPSRGQARYR